MSRCRRCNRVIKKEPFASMGIGKVCYNKEQPGSKNKSDNDLIFDYVPGHNIWISRHPDTGYITTNVQRKEYRHSPTGFNFGYAGSGTSDLALNICLMFIGKADADRVYQTFKHEFCTNPGKDGELEIQLSDIINFFTKNKCTLYENNAR